MERDIIIPCPIDETNISLDIFSRIFDDGEYIENHRDYIGFINECPVTISHRACTHVLTVRDSQARTLVYDRLSAILDINNEENPDPDYSVVAIRVGEDIRIVYQSKSKSA